MSTIPYPELAAADKKWRRSGCIHFLPENYYAYIDGFLHAADKLVKHVAEREKDQEMLLYPIAFMYYQHIKLHLQRIVDIGQTLLNDRNENNDHCGVDDLWDAAKKIIDKTLDGITESSEFQRTDEFVQQIAQIDSDATALRCSGRKTDSLSLKGAEYIGLCNLAECAHSCSKYLEMVASRLIECMDR